MINPFKVGDKVICIKAPPKGHYQCKVKAKATVRRVNDQVIYTEPDICIDYPNDDFSCYQHFSFKLDNKKLSFKAII